MPEKTVEEHGRDHDLLIEIRTQLTILVNGLTAAGLPGRCDKNEQRHISHESRLKMMESRTWAVVIGVLLSLVAAFLGLLTRL